MRFSEANLLPDGRHDETTLGDMRARWPFLAERLRAVLPARTGLRSRKKSDALLIRREWRHGDEYEQLWTVETPVGEEVGGDRLVGFLLHHPTDGVLAPVTGWPPSAGPR